MVIGKFRGFGFVAFEEEESFKKVFQLDSHVIKGKNVEIKLA